MGNPFSRYVATTRPKKAAVGKVRAMSVGKAAEFFRAKGMKAEIVDRLKGKGEEAWSACWVLARSK